MVFLTMVFEKSIFRYNAEVMIGTAKAIEQKINYINLDRDLSLVFTSNLEKVNVDENGHHIFAIVIQTKKTIKGFSK